MELHYRGATYQAPDAGAEFSEGEVIGQYRGAVLKAHRISHLPEQAPKGRMKYRGAWVK
jgi:hypothetical protein